MGFHIDNVYFDENPNYREIQLTMDILNKDIKK